LRGALLLLLELLSSVYLVFLGLPYDQPRVVLDEFYHIYIYSHWNKIQDWICHWRW